MTVCGPETSPPGAEALSRFDRPVPLPWARQNFFLVAHADRLAGKLPNAMLRIIEDSDHS